MTRRAAPGSKLRRGTQDLLERRGMMTTTGGQRPVGPVLHTTAAAGPAARPAGYGSYAALAGAAPFAHGGRRAPEERAHTGIAPGHAELKGHRHRGAEHHSAH
ncbi:hypothetical protein C7C46_02900 [Streptomyces tateyamensis]|uniref:Uncharacterized protein n=1 Tax=Streptomyces tateyamensis TaxID=565073 RepID=A0A2V4NNA4_9ACTN|nr:hypothetical protein [Streptomyces tateyamensis]PYC87714.1 hypothetical protein C7C46_02900 [Streptomyces tateyamensis]